MRKILYFTVCMLLSWSVQAQIIVNVTAPATNQFISGTPSFSFTQPVKLVVDISGIPALVAEENAGRSIYIWGFIQGCCGAPTNGDWTSSNEANKMTRESAGKWSITLPSVKDFVGASYNQAKQAARSAGRAETETRLGFLVKGKDGSGSPEKKSGDMEIAFTGPVYVATEFSTFPANYSQEDVATILYDQNLEDNATMKTQTEVYVFMEADLVGGGTITPFTPAQVATTPSLKMTDLGGKKYRFSFIPTKFFSLTGTQRISKIRITMRSKTDANINGGEKSSSLFRAQ
jgi:hypothetical protein